MIPPQLERLWSYLPSGGTLPQDVWDRRCRFLIGLAWFHAGLVALVGPFFDYSWEISFDALFRKGTVLHTLLEGGVIAAFAALASYRKAGRSYQATMVGFALMTSSAVLVHLSGGYIEFHFHFFVMVTFLALLQDWVPYLLAILYVAIHHGVVGILWPEVVFNHIAALNAPWTWAGIHAFFIFWTAVGSIVAWRFNESAAEKIKQQSAELDKINKLQADFAAMMAHDLRSPLTSVISVAAMLEEGLLGPVTEEQKKWANKIETNCHQLVDIVNDFLDLSKIEAGHINLIREVVDLKSLVRNTVETYLPVANVKKIKLRDRSDLDLPLMEVDPRRIDQVLSNLVSNALKFTPEGGEIEVGVTRHAKRVELWVKDSGSGMTPEEVTGLFQKYKQAATGKISAQKGTGLGLVICKMLVEAHGGSIQVESQSGRGSTFMISIPMEAG